MKVPLPVRTVPALTFRAWLTPPPIGSRTLARDEAATARLEPFRVGDIAGFELGSGPLVLALHGWGGRPAQMTALAHALADAGFRAVVPQLPGQAGGEMTDIKQAAAALRRLIDHVGEPVGVIGHSFASMVMRLAFPDSAPESVVLLAPALDVNHALDVFGDKLRLFPWARRGVRKRLEGWDRSLWPVVSSLYPEQMPGAEILIVHDPEDEETSFSLAAELADVRPGTELIPAPDAGHNGILVDDFALDRVIRFLTRESVPG
ncbi:MAG TPA: alpha/beta fold hydrolase [Acidimicrobiia bacterium]